MFLIVLLHQPKRAPVLVAEAVVNHRQEPGIRIQKDQLNLNLDRFGTTVNYLFQTHELSTFFKHLGALARWRAYTLEPLHISAFTFECGAARGYACLIGEGPDFFIAVGDHGEWGHAHVVFGVVDDASMRVVDAITRLPVVQQTWGQTRVTSLREPLDFTLAMARG